MNNINGGDAKSAVDDVRLAAQGPAADPQLPLPPLAELPVAAIEDLGTTVHNAETTQDAAVVIAYQKPDGDPSGVALSSGNANVQKTNIPAPPLVRPARAASLTRNKRKPDMHAYTEEEGEEEEELHRNRKPQRGSSEDNPYHAPHGTYSLNPATAALLGEEDDDMIPELTLTAIQRKHHLLRHSLPDSASGVNALPHFGVSTIDEATTMVQSMSQRELQSMFERVYNVRSMSNNNNWLRKKLLEAIHPQGLSSEINRMAGISESVTARKRIREGPDFALSYRPRKNPAFEAATDSYIDQALPGAADSGIREGEAGAERPPQGRPRRRAAAGVAAATAAVLRDPELEALEKHDTYRKLAKNSQRHAGTWKEDEGLYNNRGAYGAHGASLPHSGPMWHPQPVARGPAVHPSEDIRHRLKNEPELKQALHNLAELLSNAVTNMHAQPEQRGGLSAPGPSGHGGPRPPPAPSTGWNQGREHNKQSHVPPHTHPGHYTAHQMSEAATQWGGSFGGQRAPAMPPPPAAAAAAAPAAYAPPNFGVPNDQLLSRIMQFAQRNQVQAIRQEVHRQQLHQQMQGYPPTQPPSRPHYPPPPAAGGGSVGGVQRGAERPRPQGTTVPHGHPSAPREILNSGHAAGAPPANATLPGSSYPVDQLLASLIAMQARATQNQQPPDTNDDGNMGAAGQQ